MPITLHRFANGSTTYVSDHNANAATLEGAVNQLETGKADASLVGQASGIATLGADGKVPSGQLPNLDGYEEKARRGQANGYPELDGDGKVPAAQLPAALLAAPGTVDLTPYQQKVEKGAANGYASLDSGGKVPTAQIPSLSGTYQATSAKGAANGYAGLDGDGRVPSAQLPSSVAQLFLVHGFAGGRPADGAVLLAVLPSVAVTFAAAFAGSRAKAGVAATASTVFSIRKSGVEVGTLTFAGGSAAGVFAAAAQVDLATTDELTVEAPATADATLADVRFTLHGTR